MSTLTNVVYVAEADIVPETGMGRIAWHWRTAFADLGVNFVAIQPSVVRSGLHKAIWHRSARRYFEANNGFGANVILAHEPCSGAFIRYGIPLVVFSHGVESRDTRLDADETKRTFAESVRERIASLLWRQRRNSADLGIRKCQLLMLSNQEDKEFVSRRLGRDDGVVIFRNGADECTSAMEPLPNSPFKVLFYASWIPRKGIRTLVRAAELLEGRGICIEYTLAGAGVSEDFVRRDWPVHLHNKLTILPRIDPSLESDLYNQSHVYVLPSLAEGQPLTLLQAMAYGKCCIASACCGQKDLVFQGQNGLLFPPGDAEALAAAVEQVYHNRNLRLQLGAAARESMKNRSWSAVSHEVADLVLKTAGDSISSR